MKDFALPIYPARRATVQMAVLSVVLAVGWHVPLPGLDLDDMPKSEALLDGVSARYSVFALSLIPFFTVLAHAEIAKLAIPPLARWQNASSRNARYLAGILLVLSLALAAWHGFGLLMAMDAAMIVRHDASGFVPAGLATFIGSTALIIWLADNFGLPDLGGGFWPLMAIVVVADFPEQFQTLINFIRVGQISERQLLIVVLSLAAGLALVVFANKLLSWNVSASGVAKASILLWPPYLAGVVAGHALALFPSELRGWPVVTPSFVEIAYVVLVFVLIPVFVFAYARNFVRHQPKQRWPLPILLATSAVQMVLCIGAWLLPVSLGVPPITSGGELLVVGTVMLALTAPWVNTPPLPASRHP